MLEILLSLTLGATEGTRHPGIAPTIDPRTQGVLLMLPPIHLSLSIKDSRWELLSRLIPSSLHDPCSRPAFPLFPLPSPRGCIPLGAGG